MHSQNKCPEGAACAEAFGVGESNQKLAADAVRKMPQGGGGIPDPDLGRPDSDRISETVVDPPCGGSKNLTISDSLVRPRRRPALTSDHKEGRAAAVHNLVVEDDGSVSSELAQHRNGKAGGC